MRIMLLALYLLAGVALANEPPNHDALIEGAERPYVWALDDGTIVMCNPHDPRRCMQLAPLQPMICDATHCRAAKGVRM